MKPKGNHRGLNRLSSLVVVLLVMAVVAGCGGGAATPTPQASPTAKPSPTQAVATSTATAQPRITPTALSTAAPTATVAPTATRAPAPTPTQVRTSSGTLTLAMSNVGDEQVDPRMSSVQGKVYFELMYDMLVGIEKGKAAPATTSGLASKWSVASDGLTWTFELRPGIQFHDGKPLTAEDVKYTLDSLREPGILASNASTFNSLVKEIRVVSPTTVAIQTAFPSFTVPWLLSKAVYLEGTVLPKDYVQQVGRAGFTKHPIGSGPYKFSEQVIGSHLFLEAAGKHWETGVPKYQSIRFLVIPEESTRVAMLKSGQSDVVSVSRDKLADLKKGGYNPLRKEESIAATLIVQQMWKDTPLKNPLVRKALNLAINKEDIKNFIFNGEAQIATYPWPMGTWNIGLRPLTPVPFNRAEAIRLLKEAGYPSGFDLNFYTAPNPGISEMRSMAEAVAGDWQAIGVRTKVIPIEYGAFLAAWRQGTLQDPAMSTHRSTNLPLIHATFRTIYSSTGTYMKAAFKDTLPAEGIAPSVKVDTLITTLEQASTEAAYATALNYLAGYFWEQNLNLDLFGLAEVYASNQRAGSWDLGKAPNAMDLRGLVQQ